MKWGKKKLAKEKNVFFAGCGDTDDTGNILKRK
jgi:hypothetical protein